MSAVASLAPADNDREEARERFEHVLAGVALAGEAAVLARRLDPGFLSGAGWDPETWVLTPPAGHRFLGRPRCAAPGCPATSNGVCSGCRRRLATAGLGVTEVSQLPPLPAGRAWVRPGDGACRVAGCPRPWVKAEHPLCRSHLDDQQARGVDVAEFTALPGTVPLPSFGACAVTACDRQLPAAAAVYCDTHQLRLWQARRRGAVIDETGWRAVQSPVIRAGRVVFTGLAPLVVIQVLFGLQQRAAQGVKTRDGVLRWICDELRRQQVATLAGTRVLPGLGNDRRGTLNSLRTDARRGLLDCETETGKDDWDLTVFGHAGTLSFTAISQLWLRAAAKMWAGHDLPRRRGRCAGDKTRHHVASLALLSGSLRQRSDQGNDPGSLGRADIEAFLSRLAYLRATGAISDLTRHLACLEVRAVLSVLPGLGLTGAGAPAGLGQAFVLRRDDIAARPERAVAARDIPAGVMRQLCGNLDQIGSANIRTAVQLAIDTGRRPEEICSLAYDCLARDADGGHVLVYDNHKTNRLGRRLPISDTTAQVITAQQQRVRCRYPDAPIATLKLLPAAWRNSNGTRAITVGPLSTQHRRWVDALPMLCTDDGAEFDRTKIVLYAYRHSYAQRHADNGVGIDVLAELLDHRNLNVTRVYYRVGEDRRRAAVDTVTAMSFDRHGNRIWRDAEALLDAEHARYAIGEVAVPYGRCTEPSNVQAGGGACPVRFRCAGCDHFRTDVSYLPDLTAHLDDLLRTRERLAAAIDGVDDWARVDATPSQQEITRIRRLINRINGDLDKTGEADRAAIDEAVSVIRRHRAVHLGMPAARPATTTRTEATR